MYFTYRDDARDWFRDIKSEMGNIDFNGFYFCFMAGIAESRQKDMLSADVHDLIDYFPGPFKNRGRLMVALFLREELKSLGVEFTERSTVHAQIANLVDSNAQNHLSDEGVRRFNKYAHGGFDVLRKWFHDERPRTLEAFLNTYYKNISAL